MKRTSVRTRKLPKPPIAWREREYEALQLSPDPFADRVTEEIYDVDDEHAEVDVILHRIEHDLT